MHIMNLQDLYAIEGATFLNALHKATGINRKYLYQCATGRRQPSPRYALLLVRADGRLSLDAIYAGSDRGEGLTPDSGLTAAHSTDHQEAA